MNTSKFTSSQDSLKHLATSSSFVFEQGMKDLQKLQNFDKLLDKTLLEHDRLVRTDLGIKDYFLDKKNNPFST